MMDGLLIAVAIFLLLNVLIGLFRVLRGPSRRDRLLGVVLFGTTGTGLLAVLAAATDEPALRDVALAMVALAALVVVVTVHGERSGRGSRR